MFSISYLTQSSPSYSPSSEEKAASPKPESSTPLQKLLSVVEKELNQLPKESASASVRVDHLLGNRDEAQSPLKRKITLENEGSFPTKKRRKEFEPEKLLSKESLNKRFATIIEDFKDSTSLKRQQVERHIEEASTLHKHIKAVNETTYLCDFPKIDGTACDHEIKVKNRGLLLTRILSHLPLHMETKLPCLRADCNESAASYENFLIHKKIHNKHDGVVKINRAREYTPEYLFSKDSLNSRFDCVLKQFKNEDPKRQEVEKYIEEACGFSEYITAIDETNFRCDFPENGKPCKGEIKGNRKGEIFDLTLKHIPRHMVNKLPCPHADCTSKFSLLSSFYNHMGAHKPKGSHDKPTTEVDQ